VVVAGLGADTGTRLIESTLEFLNRIIGLTWPFVTCLLKMKGETGMSMP